MICFDIMLFSPRGPGSDVQKRFILAKRDTRPHGSFWKLEKFRTSLVLQVTTPTCRSQVPSSSLAPRLRPAVVTSGGLVAATGASIVDFHPPLRGKSVCGSICRTRVTKSWSLLWRRSSFICVCGHSKKWRARKRIFRTCSGPPSVQMCWRGGQQLSVKMLYQQCEAHFGRLGMGWRVRFPMEVFGPLYPSSEICSIENVCSCFVCVVFRCFCSRQLRFVFRRWCAQCAV